MNKKEEVLDIKLTQYGKKLLSEGNFEPMYYTFHDEGVLYDSEYALYEENQNNIEGRILNDTPSMRTQHNFTSAKESGGIIRVKKSDGSMEEIDVFQISTRAALGGELGHSAFGSQNFPSYKIKIYDGEITSVDNTYRDSFGLNIPQINCTTTARVNVRNISDIQKYQNAFQDASSPPAADGSYISAKIPSFLVEILENGALFDSENFDIEIFDIDNDEKPLSYTTKKQTQKIVNGILLDEEDQDEDFVFPTIDNVEFYFDLINDENIVPDVVSAAQAVFKSKGFYNDSVRKPIKERTTLSIADIYSSTTRPEDIEDCD
jgi:hypothetical protein